MIRWMMRVHGSQGRTVALASIEAYRGSCIRRYASEGCSLGRTPGSVRQVDIRKKTAKIARRALHDITGVTIEVKLGVLVGSCG